MLIASSRNCADNNALTSFAKSLEDIIKILEHEREAALTWFRNNRMIVNPNKFETILLNKSKSSHFEEITNIGNEKIETLSLVKLLGIEIDNKLNFNNHINTKTLRLRLRLRHFLKIEEKKSAHSEFCIIKFYLLSTCIDVVQC